eukprot:128705-Amphidinium_carterae.1
MRIQRFQTFWATRPEHKCKMHHGEQHNKHERTLDSVPYLGQPQLGSPTLMVLMRNINHHTKEDAVQHQPPYVNTTVA